MSQTVLAVILQLLALGLPQIGISVGTEALTTTVQTVILVASGLWIWYRRVQVGDISVGGVRN